MCTNPIVCWLVSSRHPILIQLARFSARWATYESIHGILLAGTRGRSGTMLPHGITFLVCGRTRPRGSLNDPITWMTSFGALSCCRNLFVWLLSFCSLELVSKFGQLILNVIKGWIHRDPLCRLVEHHHILLNACRLEMLVLIKLVVSMGLIYHVCIIRNLLDQSVVWVVPCCLEKSDILSNTALWIRRSIRSDIFSWMQGRVSPWRFKVITSHRLLRGAKFQGLRCLLV